MFQIPDKTKELAVQSSKPAMEKPEKELAKIAVSISNEDKDSFARFVEAKAKGEKY
jgi:N-acetylmuramoyl-L-alanine amidase